MVSRRFRPTPPPRSGNLLWEVVVCCSFPLIIGPDLGTFCFHLLCLRCLQTAKAALNRFKIKRKWSWESPRSSIARPWCPKWVQVEKRHKLWLCRPPFWDPFKTFSVGNLDNSSAFFLFLEATSRAVSYRLPIMGVFLQLLETVSCVILFMYNHSSRGSRDSIRCFFHVFGKS